MVSMNLLQKRRTRRPTTLSPRRMRRERRATRASELLRIVDDEPWEPHAEEAGALANERPRTRAACKSGPRPCAWISCRFHLYLDVNEATGSIKLNFPDLDPSELPESCALDIAERGGLPLERVGQLLNVTRERARQVEESGLEKIREKL